MPTLRDFQREDIDYIKEHKLRCLLASAPGVGKTIIAIRAIAETHKTSLPVLVVCPASVVRNWKREFKIWAPGLKVRLIEDTKTKIPKYDRGVYITSWALLSIRRKSLARIGFETIVADECHFAKNPEALRTRALFDLTKNAKGVLLLSGTPIINTKDELETLHTILGTSNPPMIRRLLEDVAKDIPEKRRSYLYVRMREKHQAEYDRADAQFEEWLRKEKERLLGDGMAEAEVERAMAAEALVKIGYLRRLAGEFKVPAASDWIAQAVRIGEPVVVFAEHRRVVQKLSKSLHRQRIRHCIIDGATSTKKRQEIVDAFQANKFPVFLGSKAAKEGITLTAARNLLFVERFFTSAEEEQAEDRCIARGQLVQTENGLTPIESIRVGDLVYTHKGRWRPVLGVESREVRARKRPLITEIKYKRFGMPLVCTYDHKLLALTYDRWKDGETEPLWLPATQLQPQDFLCLPVHHTTELDMRTADYIFNPIQEVTTRRDKHLRVYDLEVEEDHSFVVGHAAVHNCRRIGQRHKTTIWFLHALGSVDDRVDEIVRDKRRIIRKAIDSADIAETSTSNVESLIRSWVGHASPDVKPMDLGHGDPLPALPRPGDTHGVVFYGPRWKTQSAIRWCEMNGYEVSKKVDMTGRFKLVIHPDSSFRPHQFKMFEVCKDIRVIVGVRWSKSQERKLGRKR